MKAIILCGGKGTRLAPLSNNTPKQLLPIANKPTIFYILDQIIRSEISDIGIIVSPHNRNIMINSIGYGDNLGVNISYITQQKPIGLANAVKESRSFVNDDNFLLVLGDNLIQNDFNSIISKFENNSCDALIVIREVSDPRMFGVVELDDTGRIAKLIEKPKKPKSNLAIIGLYIFQPNIFDAIERISPSWRGEYEITDAIQNLLDTGGSLDYYIYRGIWQDIGNPGDLIVANKIILDTFISDDLNSKISSDNNLTGNIHIGKNVSLISSSIAGPCSIADNCRISSCHIGPYTSIDSNSVIQNSSLDNCIVLKDCFIENIDGLSNSVIGRKSHLYKGENGEKTRCLFIGDESTIELY
jgi:glucose-1-phosphate thymidylyltransferase